jgi:hypothetical protein
MMMMITEAISHERIADGPASVAAPRAPGSHPDPMMDVSEAHRRPTSPTSL